MEIKNYIGYEHKHYLKKQKNKKSYDSAFTFQSELKYSFEDSQVYIKIDAIKDLLNVNRSYFDISELYYSKSFENFDFDLGKKVVFQGSLEAFNPVDIFNRQNFQRDALSRYKKGSFMANVNYFFEDEAILRLYIKAFEDDIKLPSSHSVYYPFSNMSYSDEVKFSNKNEKPSFLALYTKSYDEDIIADISLGAFYGYDENILFKNNNNKTNPYLFQSAKLLSFNTFVVDSSLYKLEAVLTKVTDSSTFNIKDSYELGAGIEHTLEQIYQNHNLGLIAEYYKSNNSNISFDNDLFLALRYSLNDKDSSEFLLGVVKDLGKYEKSAYLKYSGRLSDSLNISSDIRYLKNESYLDEHLRVGCEIKYYF